MIELLMGPVLRNICMTTNKCSCTILVGGQDGVGRHTYIVSSDKTVPLYSSGYYNILWFHFEVVINCSIL